MAIKKLTILHSNDIHGDFLAKPGEDGLVTGGVAMLSGYIHKCRQEDDTIYLFAGDMFQGSLIDRDYKGASTCMIMNSLQPDAMILGNHEVDHSLNSLYVMREYYDFPVITTNLMIGDTNNTLFHPYSVIEMDGYRILVLGVTTGDILQRKGKDPELSMISYKKPEEIIPEILKDVPSDMFDLTIILSHLGLKEDGDLARALKKGSVDLIIGGHTHEDMKEPVFVNDIPIIQLANNTSHVGRFDLEIDTDKHCLAVPITEKSWKKVPINEKTSPVDSELQCLVWTFEDEVNKKYSQVISHLDQSIKTDGNRFIESQIGNLFADALQRKLDIKIVAVGSGSLRKAALDQTVSLGNLRSMYSFDEQLFRITLTGDQLIQAMTTFLRAASVREEGQHGEYYQLSEGCRFVYSVKADALTTATYDDKEIDREAFYTVGIEGMHLDNIEKYWGLRLEDVLANGQKECVSKDIYETLAKYMKNKKKNQITIAVPPLQQRTRITKEETNHG